MKCDELKEVEYPIEWGLYYDKSEADSAIAELKAKLSEKDSEIAELKEERRWRKCSEEMPKNYDEGDYFFIAVEHESTMCTKRYYVTTARLVGGQWSDEEGGDIDEDIEYDLENSIFRSQVPKGTKKGFYRSKVTHWMPLPSAPKEGK